MVSRDRYVHGHHESVVRSHAVRTVEDSAAYLIPHLTAGMHVLDVGCGPGSISVDLAQRVFPGFVRGIDVKPAIVDRAAEHAADLGVTNVTFETGSGYEIDAPDDSYDLVHAHQVLQHVAEPTRLFAEMLRVARPGGLVAARDAIYSGASWYPELPGLGEWHTAYLTAARSVGGDPDIGRRLRAIALDAGAETVESSASIWSYSSDAEREHWGLTWAERATESDFAVRAIEAGAANAEELDAISRAWRAWSEDSRGWFAIPHGEVIARKRQ